MKRTKSPPVEAATCELCDVVEQTTGDFTACEGFLVCMPCAKDHGGKLAQMRDEMDEQMRNS